MLSELIATMSVPVSPLEFHVSAGHFVVTYLSKQKLFGEVNKMKKTLQKEFIWTNNGKIFIRQDENRPSFAFEFPEDLTNNGRIFIRKGENRPFIAFEYPEDLAKLKAELVSCCVCH